VLLRIEDGDARKALRKCKKIQDKSRKQKCMKKIKKRTRTQTTKGPRKRPGPPPCISDCSDKTCGEDGCGGSCGDCNPTSNGPVSPASAAHDGDKSQPRRVIGYYAGWTSASKHYTPLDIPAERLTHVNYAFALLDAGGRAVLSDPETDIGHTTVAASPDLASLKGNFHQLRVLKARHPHLWTLISIGGWMGSAHFSDAVATEQKRRACVASCIELFLTRWPGVFDGIDIDWEYPVCCGLPENAYRPEDKENCTLLFQELRRQLDQLGTSTGRRYLLTAALPAGEKLPTMCFDLRGAAKNLDWINVMTYDMNRSESNGFTNFNAPFRPATGDPQQLAVRQAWSVEGTVRVYEEAGVPREKIVIGVPFYGRGFTGVPNVNDGLYQPFTGTMSIDYRTIKDEFLPKFRRFWHPESDVPWLYDAETGTMMSYDDAESIGRKTDFVIAEGLGGVMLWELSGDNKHLSLLTAISSRLRP
jgi:chitinase